VGGNWLGPEADFFTPSNALVMNGVILSLIFVIMASCLIKHKDNFNFVP
jgi:hypothetical protein